MNIHRQSERAVQRSLTKSALPWLLAAHLLTSVSAQAAETAVSSAAPPPLAISLARSIELAREHSFTLRDRADEQAAAELRQRAALGRFLPRVSVRARYTRFSHVEPGTFTLPLEIPGVPPPEPVQLGAAIDQQFAFRGEIEQPLFTGLALLEGYRVSREGAAIASLSAAQEQLELARKVEEAYLGLAAMRSMQSVAAGSVKMLRAHLERVETLARNERATAGDLATVRARLARARAEEVRARGGEQSARAAFLSLLGLPFGTDVVLSEAIEEPTREDDVEALEQAALRSRPELRIARHRAEIEDHRADAAEAPLWPQLALRFGVDIANPNSRYFPPQDEFHTTWDLTLALSWTAWDWGVAFHQARAADREAAIAARRVTALEDRTRVELRQALAERAATAEALHAAQDAIAASEEALRSTQQQFMHERASSIDVLDCEAELTRARAELLGSQVEHRLAGLRLERLVGSRPAASGGRQRDDSGPAPLSSGRGHD